MLKKIWDNAQSVLSRLTTSQGEAAQPKELVGVEFFAQGIALAYLTRKGHRFVLGSCDYLPLGSDQHTIQALNEAVERLSLQDKPCCLLLKHHSYRQFLLDTPDVAEEEKYAALSWQIQDFIDYPVEEALYDYTELPQKLYKGEPKLLVTVTKKALIQQVVNLLKVGGLNPFVLDVPEIASMNLFNVLPDTSVKDIAILRVIGGDCLITIFHDKELGVTRHVEPGLSQPDDIDEQSEAILAQEVSRTFQYYITEARQDYPGAIYLLPADPEWQLLEEQIQKNLGDQVTLINWRRVLDCPQDLEPKILRQCTGAICAALRTLERGDYEAAD